MPTTSYTQRFTLQRGDGVTQSYVVPEDHRIVVKGAVVNTGGVGEHLFFITAHGYVVFQWRAPGAYAAAFLPLLLVLYERETLSVTSYGPDIGVMVSGYIFKDQLGPVGEVSRTLAQDLNPRPLPV